MVVYDEAGLSWTNRPLPIEHCLSVVEQMDREGKVVLLPGNFHGTGLPPLEAETFERNAGIAALGDDGRLGRADRHRRGARRPWPASSRRSARADAEGRSALDYPARWLYGHVGGQLYLERCRRTWGISAGYPGPMAVRAGHHPHASPASATCPSGGSTSGDETPTPPTPVTPGWTSGSARAEGIWHFSWVRSEEEMRDKAASSGHADEVDWGKEIDRWLGRCRHPRLATLLTPVRGRPAVVGAPTWLRTARVPDPIVADLE